ncbi:GNAT family N-acetyltransferase [Streptomyces sp. 049-1]|uniref:GNAT family N-acetyltransferase n=1 Tax=Streptomyces sp. 049-1 TaxID=2789264 RepID=UPI003980284C
MTSSERHATGSEDIEVADNVDGRFYELRLGGQAAGMLVYETAGSRRVLTHTTIREDYRGRGWSKLLIRHALDDLAAKGATISTYCEVVDRFIEENPEYARLIDSSQPGGRGHYQSQQGARPGR